MSGEWEGGDVTDAAPRKSVKPARASAVRASGASGVGVRRADVIRRPDVTDDELLRRLQAARRLGGVKGLVEALVAECELPGEWELEVEGADVRPE